MSDSDTTIAELKATYQKFSLDRGWDAHLTPANLAVSISVEAGELLECFQWGDNNPSTKEQWAGELADIVSYCLHFSRMTGIDLSQALTKKLEKLEQKFPLDKFSTDGQKLEDYWATKKKYREAS
jgi:dCTP diphosphatase